MKNTAIKNLFSSYRNKLKDFYPTEQFVLYKVLDNYKFPHILDLGCACGGLYNAILEIKSNFNYLGVDIDKESIDLAKSNNYNAQFINSDFLKFLRKTKNKFDIITSLSCIDWDTANNNNEFYSVLNLIYNKLNQGGTLIISLRISKKQSFFNSEKSYQIITNGEHKIKASYGIISENELIESLKKLKIKKLTASAFYGKPSSTSTTPENELLFCVLGITKGRAGTKGIIYKLDVPDDFKKILIF